MLLLSMHAPRSYTCEDVVEIHTHGGGVCASRVLQVRHGCLRHASQQRLPHGHLSFKTRPAALCVRVQACVEAGARLARPGEFTLRAFLNGRLDLAQVCVRCVRLAVGTSRTGASVGCWRRGRGLRQGQRRRWVGFAGSPTGGALRREGAFCLVQPTRALPASARERGCCGPNAWLAPVW